MHPWLVVVVVRTSGNSGHLWQVVCKQDCSKRRASSRCRGSSPTENQHYHFFARVQLLPCLVINSLLKLDLHDSDCRKTRIPDLLSLLITISILVFKRVLAITWWQLDSSLLTYWNRLISDWWSWWCCRWCWGPQSSSGTGRIERKYLGLQEQQLQGGLPQGAGCL